MARQDSRHRDRSSENGKDAECTYSSKIGTGKIVPGHSSLRLSHSLTEQTVKVLVRLCTCAGSPEPSLLAYAIKGNWVIVSFFFFFFFLHHIDIYSFKINSNFLNSPCSSRVHCLNEQ